MDEKDGGMMMDEQNTTLLNCTIIIVSYTTFYLCRGGVLCSLEYAREERKRGSEKGRRREYKTL